MGRIIRLFSMLFAVSSLVVLPLEALSGRLHWTMTALVASVGLCIAAMLFSIGNRMIARSAKTIDLTPEINQLQLTPGSFQERFWRQSPRLRMCVYFSLLGFGLLLAAGVLWRFLQGQPTNILSFLVVWACGHTGIAGLSREHKIARQKLIDQLRAEVEC